MEKAELEKRATKSVMTMLAVQSNIIQEATKDLSEEDTGTFGMYYAKALGALLNAAENADDNFDFDSFIEMARELSNEGS